MRPQYLISLAILATSVVLLSSAVIAAPAEQGPVVPTRRPTQTPLPATNTPTATATPAATDTPTSTPTATNTATPATPVVEAVRDMTVRGGPGQDYPNVATLEANAQLDIIGISEDGSWYQVLLPDGSTGWLSSSNAIVNTYGDIRLVPLALPPTNTPTDTPTATETPTSTFTPTITPTETPTPTSAPTEAAGPASIEFGATAQGSIQGNVSEMRYTFQGQAGTTIDIRMNNTGGDLDPLLILLDPNGQEITRNDDDPSGLNRDAHIAGFVLPVTGTYTIVATRFQEAQGFSEGSFSVTLNTGAPQPPTPIVSTPQVGVNSIVYGQTVTGAIQGATSEVRYSFNAQPGDVVDIQMVSTSGDLDPLLILYGPNGAEVARDDDSAGNLNALLHFTVPTAGTYTVSATRYEFSTTQGTFTLTLTSAGTGPVVTGNTIAYGQTTNGAISSSAPAVNYTFSGQAGDVVEIRMNNTSGDLDPLLILRGPNDAEIARDDDGGGAGNSYIRTLTLPASGLYTIVATRYQEAAGTSQGNFTLTLTGTRAGVAPTPVAGTSTIAYGQTVTGAIQGTASAVRYTFNAQAGDIVTIRMEATSGDLDPLLILLGPNGAEVARDDDSAGNLNALLQSFTLSTSGTYTIVATRFSEATGTSQGAFNLSLTPGTGPVQPTTGSTISLGQSVSGNIGSASPEIHYTFSAQAGQVVSIKLGRTSGNLDSLLILLGPDGSEVATNDDDYLGKNLDSYIRGFTIPTSGTYTIVATRYQQAQGDSQGNFELSLFEGSRFDQPMTTISQLTPESSLAVGSTVSGNISDAQYVHLYSLQGTAGQVLTLSMERTSGSLDSYIIVLDPNGREIARNDDATTETIDAQISGLTLTANGVYSIVATRYLQHAGESDGSFNLSVTTGSSGTIVGAFAQPMTYGSTQSGAIDDQNYLYTYNFQGSAGDVVNVRMTPTSGDLDCVLFLTDSVGNIIASDYANSGSNALILGAPLQANGFYTIVAMRYHADIGSTSGNFQLELTQQ